MTSTVPVEETKEDPTKNNIAFFLFPLPTAELRAQLEEFRIRYEARCGKTDLTARYTSTWPEDQKLWLTNNDIQTYWDGFPPFAQAFIKERMQSAHKNGKLDDMPTQYIPLYMSGGMRIGGRGQSRD